MKTPILSFVFLLLPAMFSSACNNSTKNVHDAPSAVIWQDDSTDTNNALMEQTLYTPRDSAEVVEILKKSSRVLTSLRLHAISSTAHTWQARSKAMIQKNSWSIFANSTAPHW